MFCSRCGTSITEDLNFCSKCGERVSKTEVAEKESVQKNMMDSLSIVSIFIGAGGMLFLIGLVAVLLDKVVSMQTVAFICTVYIAAWFAIMYKLLRQISRLVDANLEERKLRPADNSPPLQFPAKTTAQLEAFREPASVTEPTTRTLDEVPIKRSV